MELKLLIALGTVFIAAFAAGCIEIPAEATYATAVAATDENNKITDFSSWGPTDDMRTKPEPAAPGTNIPGPRANGTSLGNPIDDYFISASGTSASTPFIAATYALLKQVAETENINLTPSGLKALILNSVDPLLDESGKPYPEYAARGLVNATAAYQLLLKMKESNQSLTAIIPTRFTTSSINLSDPDETYERYFKIVLVNDRPIENIVAAVDSPWMTVTPSSATAEANNHTVFSVNIYAEGLTAPLKGNVTISYPGNSYRIPVKVPIKKTVPIPTPTGVIKGRVFEDQNGNGLDDEEPGLGNRSVYMVRGSNITGTTTNEKGEYNFSYLPPDIYALTLIVPPGWIPTTLTYRQVNLTGNLNLTVDFGRDVR